MQYPQFLGTLKRRSLSHVYIFFGEEDFLKEEALERLEQILFCEKGVAEKDVFEEDVSASVLNEKLTTSSLFGKSGLVIIKNTQELDKNCREILSQYIKNPGANYLVIFLDKEEDKREWGQTGTVSCLPATFSPFFVEFKKFYEAGLLSWLISRARDNKKFLSADSARVFLEQAGCDLALLSNALDRVINYIGPKSKIEPKDIEEILSDERKDAVFDLTDALASQDLSTSLSILKRLFLSLTPPQQIISLLSWQIRQLYTLKRGGEVKIPPFVLKRLKTQAQSFSEEKLEKCLWGLREVDTEIKTGLRNPKLSLELFFFKFFKLEEANICP